MGPVEQAVQTLGYSFHDRLAWHALCPCSCARSAPQDAEDQGRQGRGGRRRADLGAVDVHHANHGHQRDPAADRRAHGIRLRHRARGVPEPGRRRGAAGDCQEVADPRDRRHPLPAEVRLRCHRRRLRGRSGEPGQHPQVRRPGQADRAGRQGCRVSIRIGVNAGSLDPRLLEKYGKATAEALVESAVWEASLFEEHDFHDFKISVKHNDPVVMVRAYEMLSERGDWPLHLGVTEAGRRSRAPSSRRPRSARCCPRASATPSASRCRPLPSKRSRSATRSSSRSTSSPASSRSSRAPRVGAPRSMCTSWPTRSPPASRA